MARQSWPRSPLTQSLIVAITLLQQIHAQGYAEECFPDYGSCSQQVIVPLYIAAGCACPGPSGCACLNDTYLFNVMMDVGACCSLVEVNNTAQTSADNCNTDGTPMLVSVAELIDTGKAGASSSCPIAALATLESSSASTQSSSTSTQFPSSTTTTPTQSKGSNQGSSETSTSSTTTSTSSSSSSITPTASPSFSGLTEGEKIGVGIAVPIVFLALVGVCLGIWWCCFRRRKSLDPTLGPAPPPTCQSVSTDKEVSKVGGTVAAAHVSEIYTPTVAGSFSQTATDPHQDRNSSYYYMGQSPSLLDSVPVARPYQDGVELDAGTYHRSPHQFYSGHPEPGPRPPQEPNYGAPEGVYELGHAPV